MFIQLENNTVVNTDNIILAPYGDKDNIPVEGYRVLTSQDLRTVTEISPRECEIILLLTANPPEQKMVLRTPEWGIVGDRLNYRYAKVLSASVDGGYGTDGLLTWLKAQLKKAAGEDSTFESPFEMATILQRLSQDAEFEAFTAGGRKLVSDIINAYTAPAKKRIQDVLDRWDDIFDELPF